MKIDGNLYVQFLRLLIRALMFRQDYRIKKIFCLSCLRLGEPTPRREERQKASSLFEGRRSLIAPTKQ